MDIHGREKSMFGIGFQEMVIILVIALIFFGPKRLPDLAKSIGKGIAEFKKASDEVRRGIDEAIKEESADPETAPPPTPAGENPYDEAAKPAAPAAGPGAGPGPGADGGKDAPPTSTTPAG